MKRPDTKDQQREQALASIGTVYHEAVVPCLVKSMWSILLTGDKLTRTHHCVECQGTSNPIKPRESVDPREKDAVAF